MPDTHRAEFLDDVPTGFCECGQPWPHTTGSPTMPDTPDPRFAAWLASHKSGMHWGCGATNDPPMCNVERLAAHIGTLTAAVRNLPRWSMVGEMNNRHMEAERDGHYFDAAAVLAILAEKEPHDA